MLLGWDDVLILDGESAIGNVNQILLVVRVVAAPLVRITCCDFHRDQFMEEESNHLRFGEDVNADLGMMPYR